MSNQNYSPWPQQQQKPKGGGLFGGGDKRSTRDIIAIALSSLGDSIGEHTNGIKGQSLNGLMKRFQDQRDQAAKQEEEQRLIQVAKAAGYGDNQAPAVVAGMSLPPAPKPGSFEWYQGADPEGRKTYDEYNPLVVQGKDGPMRVPRNRPAINSTVRMEDIGGPPQPTQQEGSGGVLTRGQWATVVNTLGQAGAENWRRTNNVRIGD